MPLLQSEATKRIRELTTIDLRAEHQEFENGRIFVKFVRFVFVKNELRGLFDDKLYESFNVDDSSE